MWTNDLPAGLGRDLARLGRVEPPAPGVLDAARERLWAAVAAEMLPAKEDTGARERLWAAVAAEMLSAEEDAGARNAAGQESPRHARRQGEPDA